MREVKKQGVTAADVAAAAGVSQSTVSRVINDVHTPFISEKTNLLVRKVARELGYSPNPIARALRNQRTNLIGLIVREIADPFFAEFVAALTTQARSRGYQVILAHARSDPKEGLAMTGVLDIRHCAGVLLLGDLRDDQHALQQMLQDNPAVVALCRGKSPSQAVTINADNRAGMRQLLDHLYDLGHRRFAFIDGGWLGDIRERREAFVEYTNERNLPVPRKWIRKEANDAHGGYRAMQKLLTFNPRPTAVIAADDVMAIGAIRAATDAGLSVPGEISVVGFDDVPVGCFISPSLTTVRQPIEAMSFHALSLLSELIDGEFNIEERRLIQLMPELIVRESSGAALPI